MTEPPPRTVAVQDPPPRDSRRGGSVFRNRSFTLLFSAFGMSFLGDYVARIGYPLAALAVTGSPVAAGWAGFAANLPSLLFTLPAGWAADTWDRRRILLVCQVAGALVAAGVFAAVLAGGPLLLPALMGGAFAEGSVAVTASFARLRGIRAVVRPEQRSAALSAYQVMSHSALLAGRGLGGVLYGLAHWLPFGANLLSYAGSAALLSAIPAEAMASAESGGAEKPAVRTGVLESFRWLRQDRFIRFCVLSVTTSNMLFQVVQLFLIVAVRHNGAPWQVGLVLAASGVGGVVGGSRAPAALRVWSAQTIVVGALWVWVALVTAMACTQAPLLLALLNLGVGGVGAFSNVAMDVYMLDAVPEDLLGRVSAASEILPNSAVAVGAAVAGYPLAAAGTGATSAGLAVAMTALALWATLHTRSLALTGR